MNMTHYIELLATNQPWNLLIFMAIQKWLRLSEQIYPKR
jgi:hypothetical protein